VVALGFEKEGRFKPARILERVAGFARFESVGGGSEEIGAFRGSGSLL
jgi:hypothetical protein